MGIKFYTREEFDKVRSDYTQLNIPYSSKTVKYKGAEYQYIGTFSSPTSKWTKVGLIIKALVISLLTIGFGLLILEVQENFLGKRLDRIMIKKEQKAAPGPPPTTAPTLGTGVAPNPNPSNNGNVPAGATATPIQPSILPVAKPNATSQPPVAPFQTPNKVDASIKSLPAVVGKEPPKTVLEKIKSIGRRIIGKKKEKKEHHVDIVTTVQLKNNNQIEIDNKLITSPQTSTTVLKTPLSKAKDAG